MEKLDKFKEFVKNNPKLLKYVKNETMTWQKFYEIYDMYGDEVDVWKDYLVEEKTNDNKKIVATSSLGELLGFFKGINLDNVQEGIQSIGRVVGMLGDLTNKGNTSSSTDYKPRPLYKHFDD